ncbi:hypothetical protein VTN96DRAFT_4470 [Rasamsonia emersonii]
MHIRLGVSSWVVLWAIYTITLLPTTDAFSKRPFPSSSSISKNSTTPRTSYAFTRSKSLGLSSSSQIPGASNPTPSTSHTHSPPSSPSSTVPQQASSTVNLGTSSRHSSISISTPQNAATSPGSTTAPRSTTSTGRLSSPTPGSSIAAATTSRGGNDFGPSIFTTTVVTSGPSSTHTEVIPFISGGDVTSAIPVQATTTIDPSGIEASSSARELQTQLAAIIPVIKSFIDDPQTQNAENAITSIKKVEPEAEELMAKLGSSSGSKKSCSVNTNLITDLFNAVSCVTDNLNKAVTEIEGGINNGFKNVNDVESTLTNLENLQKPLDSNQQESNKPTESAQSTESKTSSQTSSQTSSCTASSTVLDVFVGCFVTAAPGRRGQGAQSCTTSKSTITGCDLTATTTTTFSSCTSMQTASDCRAICPSVTSTPERVRSQSCSTTCYSTFTGCDITGTTTTTYTSPDACPMLTSGAATTTIQGPFVTAWWDYGLSCAGSCSAFSVPSGSASGSPLGTAVSTPSSTTKSSSGTRSQASSRTRSSSLTPTPTKTPTITTPPATTQVTTRETTTTSRESSTTTPRASSTITPAPICSEGSNELMGVNNEPSSWCFCGGRGPFSTIPGATTSYCNFSTLPSQTITLTSHSTSVNTGCVVTTTTYTQSSASDRVTTATQCQCGDVIAAFETTTSGNAVIAGCALPTSWALKKTISTITPTPTLNPNATGTIQCFPTHGTSEADKLIQVSNFDPAEFCAKNQSDWLYVGSSDPLTPAGNNYIFSGYTLDEHAPAECHHLYTSGSTKLEQDLCYEPLKAIAKACPWNGGQARNVCGLWWLQTCPLGKTCPKGDPS